MRGRSSATKESRYCFSGFAGLGCSRPRDPLVCWPGRLPPPEDPPAYWPGGAPTPRPPPVHCPGRGAGHTARIPLPAWPPTARESSRDRARGGQKKRAGLRRTQIPAPLLAWLGQKRIKNSCLVSLCLETKNVHVSFCFLAVSGRFRAQAGPETPVFGSGSKNAADITQNQPRKLILLPFRAVPLVDT